ncbi:hypothetical protein Sjap_012863 [Stephania japonica]|uniref:Transcription elongation factor 1 homolog n=1 Tax=Stephania japonica TaxID=461633 RepID=A0AAP0IWW8_9MAGN
MGKRKSRSKPAPKKRTDRLDSVFNCPFCNHEKSVDCTFDKDNKLGTVLCRICQESYSTPINQHCKSMLVICMDAGGI